MNPWTGFCLYVAGLVYCHNLGSSPQPNRDDILSATFLLTIMRAIGKSHSITEYFSVQLELEMDAAQGRRTCKQGSDRLEAFDEYQHPNDPRPGVQSSETQTRFWKLLSVEERASLSQKFLSSKPLEGIMVLGCDGFSPENNPH